MADARPSNGILVLLVIVTLTTSGCMRSPDGPDGPPQLPPWIVTFEQGDLVQTNITYWDTQFVVTWTDELEVHPIADVYLTFYDPADEELPNPNITYRDLDGDGNVSEGDVISVEAMTDVYLDGWFEMAGIDEVLGFSTIVRYAEDRLVLTLGFGWVYPADRNGTLWDTRIQIRHHRTEVPMHVGNVSFQVVSGAGTVMEVADVVFNDTDGDGMVSRWDRVELYGATPDYQGAWVRILYDGRLVGVRDLPNFIPS